jgi:carbon storage regulator
MLVLSRKTGEEILIGENVRLVINRVSGNRVTIGIVAPPDMHIVRRELLPLPAAADATAGQQKAGAS